MMLPSTQLCTCALMLLCTCALCSYPLCTYVLYNCRFPTTNVMISLQIRLFMQNKPNFRKSQMNVNKVLTGNYENKTLGERGKKQSQTNPNKAKFKNTQTNVNKVSTKNYEHILNWVICENKANSKPNKPNQTQSRNNSRAPMIAIVFDLFSGHNYHEVVPNFYLSFCTLIFGTPVRSVCIHI